MIECQAQYTVNAIKKTIEKEASTIEVCTTSLLSLYIGKSFTEIKRGSRHAARAAKALRWRVEQLLKRLIKKISLSS